MSFEALQKLSFNEETGLYSIIEAGFKYEFPQSLHEDFKNYILNYIFVSRWYKHLEITEMQKVSRTSAYE